MGQSSRCAAGVLLGAGLLVASGWVRGQRPDAPPPPPAAWAPSAAGQPPRVLSLDGVATPLPQPAPAQGVAKVIATSKPRPQPTGPGLPLPDDGLSPPKPHDVVAAPKWPEPPPTGSVIRPTVPQAPASRAGESAAIVRVVATEPAGPPAAPPPGPAGPGSQVSVEITAPGRVAPGDSVPFEIIVRNSSPLAVASVRLEGQVPVGTRLLRAQPEPEMRENRLSWNLGNLEGGGERRLKIELQAGGEGELTLAPVVTFAAAFGPRVRVVRPPFAVNQAVPERARRGEPVAIQIRVSNNTPAPLKHVVVRDQLPDGLQHAQGNFIEAEIGTLAPNETKALRLEALAVRSGQFLNEVVTTADDGLECRSRSPVVVAEPSLTVRLDVLRQTLADHEIEVRLEAANPGAAPAHNARVSAAVPNGMDFVAASEGGHFDPGTRAVVWTLAALPPGKTQITSCRLRARGLGEQALRAVAVAEGMAEARASAALRVEGAPALRLEITYRDAQVEVNAEAGYEVRVFNQGSAPSPNVRLVVTLPEGLVPVRGEGPAASRVQGQQVLFEPLASMAPRADAVYRIRARATRPGDYRFRAELLSDQLARPVVAEENTHAYSDGVGSSPTTRGR